VNYVILVIGTFIASLASFCFKKSGSGVGVAGIFRSPMVYLGGFLYVLSSIVTIWLLQRLPYSVVLPMGGICYIWTLLISHKFLGEKINRYKVLGVVFIIAGVLLISGSNLLH
jgi:drug/metabolite transporter (DMT)-like permease